MILGWSIREATLVPRCEGQLLTRTYRDKYLFHAEFNETRVYE